MGGKGGGGKKGGGGSGSIDVDVDSESTSSMALDIIGLDDVNIATTSNNQSRTELALTEPIDTRLTLSVPDPIRTEQLQRTELAITEPIVTQMSAEIDVKPVVLDLCLTVGIKDLPRVCISRPYDRHVGLSILGREVIGFTWCGNSQFIIDDVRPRTYIAGVNELGSPPAVQKRPRDHEPVVHDEAGGPGVRIVVD